MFLSFPFLRSKIYFVLPCSSEPSYTSDGSTLAEGNRPQSINFWNFNHLLEKNQLRLLLIPPNHTKKNHMKSKNGTLGERCFFFKSIVAPFQIRSSHRFRCWKKYCIPLPLNLLMIPQRKNSRNIYIKVPKIPGPYMDMLFSAYAAIKETQAFYWPYVDTNEGLPTWSLT